MTSEVIEAASGHTGMQGGAKTSAGGDAENIAKRDEVIQEVRDNLLELGHVSQADGYECVLMQGSGTMCVESVLSSVVPKRRSSC